MGNFQAPELAPEQKRTDELKAQGLRRSSFDGRLEKIPEPDKPMTAAELEEGWAKIRQEAAARTAAEKAAASEAASAVAAVAAEAAAEKEAAWQRYVNLAGRTADGGLVASRQIFESTWQRHLAQRAIAESLAPATG